MKPRLMVPVTLHVIWNPFGSFQSLAILVPSCPTVFSLGFLRLNELTFCFPLQYFIIFPILVPTRFIFCRFQVSLSERTNILWSFTVLFNLLHPRSYLVYYRLWYLFCVFLSERADIFHLVEYEFVQTLRSHGTLIFQNHKIKSYYLFDQKGNCNVLHLIWTKTEAELNKYCCDPLL